jgi:acyl-coenzyme A thioesterase PaaI-like protein
MSDRPAISWKTRLLFRLMRFYPPYLGAGIRVRERSPALDRFVVEMRLHWWNRNYVGTHFGGSLYSMCDPFFMLILFQQLGHDHIVWDKAATIRFKRPGKGTVRATFHVPAEEIERIRQAALVERKVEPVFTTEVVGEAGEVVAEVEKVLYVRRKD